MAAQLEPSTDYSTHKLTSCYLGIMTTATSFGDLNSGLQAGIINGNVTAQFRDMGSHNVIAGNDININYLTEIRPLAESLYRSLFSPSELFGRVQNELGLLISVLNATEHHASCYAKDIHRREVNAALEECHDLLLGLSKMKTHFDSMDHQTRVTWERLKWGVGDLEDMRTRLSTHVQNLTMLNTNMIMSSQANVENMLKKFIYEIRTGIRDRSSVSSISNGSPAPSDEELEAWREVRKELQGVGITPELFLQHREFITTTLRSSLDKGDLGEFSFEQYGYHEIQPVSHRQEVSSRSMAFSTSSERIPTDQLSAQAQTAGPKWKTSMERHAPTSYYGSHGNPVYHDSIRPAQPQGGAHLAPLHYFRGSVMQEANTKNVHSFRFNMWASAPQRANRIEKALHTYTRLQGDLHHPNAPPMPLEGVCGWRTSFPYLVSSLDEMNSPLNCDIILLEVNLELMTSFPPSGSRLSIQLDLEFGHPTTSNVLMVNQMNDWTCRTRLYKEGREHWETYHDLSKPQSTKVKPLFESSWWARLFIELTKDKRIAEDSGQPESIYTTEEYTYDLFSSLSMVQEIRAIPSPPSWRRLSDEFQGHQGEESERMAILLWKFRRTRPGEVGTTTWRRVIPP